MKKHRDITFVTTMMNVQVEMEKKYGKIKIDKKL